MRGRGHPPDQRLERRRDARRCPGAQAGLDSPALANVVIELAAACLEGAALARALFVLQEAADQREAEAARALAVLAKQPYDGQASWVALRSLQELGRINREELTAAANWGEHVARTRVLAHDALVVSRLASDYEHSR
jgi:hypothetical protein